LRRFPALLLALLSTLVAGCGRGTPVHDGPIVFITLNALRADVVDPVLTPQLDKLMRSADWAGRAIAPSSSVIPSTAALLTGLRPWQSQVLGHGRSDLPDDILTLPVALQAVGYRTQGYYHGRWMARESGYARGFDSYDLLGDGDAALDRVAHLSAGRELVWVHIPEPQPPYVRRGWLLSRFQDLAPGLPPEIRLTELAAYSDPSVPLPPEVRRRFWDLYRVHVAWADERLGRLLDAVRQSGQWDRALIVVTSTHGEAFGERGQIADGGSLGRELIEVPLAVKLPAGWRRPLAVPRSERVAAARLWATVVEAAGGPVPPAVAPSLFTRSPGPLPVLSELYDRNGVNLYSLVDGDDQLLWESRFAPAEPEYYRARLIEMPGSRLTGPPLREDSEVILGRLATAFATTRPFSGIAPPRLSLERWEGGSGSRPLDDPKRQAELAAQLRRAWYRFVPEELSPDGEDQARQGTPPGR